MFQVSITLFTYETFFLTFINQLLDLEFILQELLYYNFLFNQQNVTHFTIEYLYFLDYHINYLHLRSTTFFVITKMNLTTKPFHIKMNQFQKNQNQAHEVIKGMKVVFRFTNFVFKDYQLVFEFQNKLQILHELIFLH